jgi:hypothetical protein
MEINFTQMGNVAYQLTRTRKGSRTQIILLLRLICRLFCDASIQLLSDWRIMPFEKKIGSNNAFRIQSFCIWRIYFLRYITLNIASHSIWLNFGLWYSVRKFTFALDHVSPLLAFLYITGCYKEKLYIRILILHRAVNLQRDVLRRIILYITQHKFQHCHWQWSKIYINFQQPNLLSLKFI